MSPTNRVPTSSLCTLPWGTAHDPRYQTISLLPNQHDLRPLSFQLHPAKLCVFVIDVLHIALCFVHRHNSSHLLLDICFSLVPTPRWDFALIKLVNFGGGTSTRIIRGDLAVEDLACCADSPLGFREEVDENAQEWEGCRTEHETCSDTEHFEDLRNGVSKDGMSIVGQQRKFGNETNVAAIAEGVPQTPRAAMVLTALLAHISGYYLYF